MILSKKLSVLAATGVFYLQQKGVDVSDVTIEALGIPKEDIMYYFSGGYMIIQGFIDSVKELTKAIYAFMEKRNESSTDGEALQRR